MDKRDKKGPKMNQKCSKKYKKWTNYAQKMVQVEQK